MSSQPQTPTGGAITIMQQQSPLQQAQHALQLQSARSRGAAPLFGAAIDLIDATTTHPVQDARELSPARRHSLRASRRSLGPIIPVPPSSSSSSSSSQPPSAASPHSSSPTAASITAASSQSSTNSPRGSTNAGSSNNNNRRGGKRIALIIDNNTLSQRLSSVALHRAGFTSCDLAPEGETAISMCHTTRYDLILIDTTLPTLSGIETTRAIRWLEDQRNGSAGEQTPSIAISTSCIIALTHQVDPTSLDTYRTSRINACIERGSIIAEAVSDALETLARNPNFLFISAAGVKTQEPSLRNVNGVGGVLAASAPISGTESLLESGSPLSRVPRRLNMARDRPRSRPTSNSPDAPAGRHLQQPVQLQPPQPPHQSQSQHQSMNHHLPSSFHSASSSSSATAPPTNATLAALANSAHQPVTVSRNLSRHAPLFGTAIDLIDATSAHHVQDSRDLSPAGRHSLRASRRSGAVLAPIQTQNGMTTNNTTTNSSQNNSPRATSNGGVRRGGSNKKIGLIVDNNTLSQRLSSVAIHRAGFISSDIASEGESAISMSQTTRYDLILIDTTLPTLSGIETSRAIRWLEDQRGDVPTVIICLTTVIDPTAIESYRSNGINACIERGCIIAEAVVDILDSLTRNPNFVTITSAGVKTQEPRTEAQEAAAEQAMMTACLSSGRITRRGTGMNINSAMQNILASPLRSRNASPTPFALRDEVHAPSVRSNRRTTATGKNFPIVKSANTTMMVNTGTGGTTASMNNAQQGGQQQQQLHAPVPFQPISFPAVPQAQQQQQQQIHQQHQPQRGSLTVQTQLLQQPQPQQQVYQPSPILTGGGVWGGIGAWANSSSNNNMLFRTDSPYSPLTPTSPIQFGRNSPLLFGREFSNSISNSTSYSSSSTFLYNPIGKSGGGISSGSAGISAPSSGASTSNGSTSPATPTGTILPFQLVPQPPSSSSSQQPQPMQPMMMHSHLTQPVQTKPRRASLSIHSYKDTHALNVNHRA